MSEESIGIDVPDFDKANVSSKRYFAVSPQGFASSEAGMTAPLRFMRFALTSELDVIGSQFSPKLLSDFPRNCL